MNPTANPGSLGGEATVRDRLVELSRRIDALRSDHNTTLDPSRARATSLVELHARLAEGRAAEVGRALACGMASVAEAVLEAFPGNLFWDFDFVFGSLIREAEGSGENLANHVLGY